MQTNTRNILRTNPSSTVTPLDIHRSASRAADTIRLMRIDIPAHARAIERVLSKMKRLPLEITPCIHTLHSSFISYAATNSAVCSGKFHWPLPRGQTERNARIPYDVCVCVFLCCRYIYAAGARRRSARSSRIIIIRVLLFR